MIHTLKPIPAPINWENGEFFQVGEKIYVAFHQVFEFDKEPGRFLSQVRVDGIRLLSVQDENSIIICRCGCDEFKVIRSNDYETSARCCNCGAMEVVHDG